MLYVQFALLYIVFAIEALYSLVRRIALLIVSV